MQLVVGVVSRTNSDSHTSSGQSKVDCRSQMDQQSANICKGLHQ